MNRIFVLLILLMPSGCNTTPDITDEMLDGLIIFDPSINNKEGCLVSYAIPHPTPAQAATPVIIACHGYTATTFEWDEFHEWMGNRNDVYLSQVLLGGHGTTYEDFKNSSWRDWQKSIVEEYDRLRQTGFTNISMVGSSTSCALILELFSSGYFGSNNAPENVFFVDPIVISSNKLLSLIGILGPVLGYTEEDQTPEEDRVWYHFRPQETLRELQNLLNVVRKDLQRGIKLPSDVGFKVYKSKKDPTADPVSVVLIYKGVKKSDGIPVEVEMVDSELHVFTRLELRKEVTQKDRANQVAAFTEILWKVLE